MTRNLDRRIELMFPVESAENRARVLHALRMMFRDTVKARWLRPDGTYERRGPSAGEPPFRVQQHLQAEARRTRGRRPRARRHRVQARSLPGVTAFIRGA